MPTVLRPPLRARLTALRKRRYPVWTTTRAFGVTLAAIALCAMLFFVLQLSPLVETEIFLLAVSGCLMLFLTWGLYHGVRLKRETPESATFKPAQVKQDDVVDGWHAPDLPFADGDDGCLGAIIVLVLWLLITLLLIGLLAPLLNVFLAVFAVMLSAVFWVFYRALRLTLVHGRRCRGNLLKSAGYAGGYTFLYTGWLLAIVWGAGLLAQRWAAG